MGVVESLRLLWKIFLTVKKEPIIGVRGCWLTKKFENIEILVILRVSSSLVLRKFLNDCKINF